MDQDRELTGELERLQSNIATLFRSVLKDRNKYKNEKEKSIASVESLMTEITLLRKENEQLKRSNNIGSSCVTCSELKEQLIMHDSRSKKLEKTLDILREMLCNVPHQDGNPHLSKFLSQKFDELKNESLCLKSTRSNSVDNDLSACKDKHNLVIYDTLCEKTDPNNCKAEEGKSGENKSSLPSEAWGKESYLDLISMSADSKGRFKKMEFSTPRKGDKSGPDFASYPFCADNVIKELERSPILVDQRFIMSKNTFPGSPSALKRKSDETVSESPGKFRIRTLFPKSPKQRKYMSSVKGSRVKSASQLKSTNSVDVEISLSGVRKLKQTQLNPDYYKSVSEDSGSASKCNGNLNDDSRFGEDDLILESPKHSANFFDEFRKTFKREESLEEMISKDGKHSNSASIEVFDPEETFVSSTFIRNSMKDLKTTEPQGEVSPDAREGSPEYNTMAYPYKGSPVRTKAERMRLPGHTCTTCNKYYKAILGEIDPIKFQEILNQCSRHRDQHYNIVDTPPGYWKPYLTATMDSSTAEENTHFDEIL